ncbi:hypothetical protein Rumeso_04581 [Rubellimicrobium mesophilum DSM 19309]|uniref:Uncharacterized protein n=1 Tax=Rubellimicrobium mesophilum DSM 19309 TaxID=442562 RepID=A0A017HHL6_9RHOB|nr:hypothetical protein [Rubellimicrobium mesophilum]EYD73846.1 hypothetical protein Rumeso_04581 [Rubellimicrobium mesophilum DSM 19309]
MTSALYLHNPASEAHIEDLLDRLTGQIAQAPQGAGQQRVPVADLVEVVRAMDRGDLTPKQALKVFAHHSVPGFSFGRWLVEMVDEGVYLEDIYNEAA